MSALTVLSEEEQMFREEVAKFAQEVIAPKVSVMDQDEILAPEIIQQCFELGLMGIELSSDLGGADGSFFMACLAIEEISKVDPGVGVFVDVQNTLVNNVFRRWASSEQQNKYLPLLCSKDVGAFCLTEANSGSDAFALTCQAERHQDGWLLSGRKLFITNAAEANIFIVFANAKPELGYKGISAFIVDKSQHSGIQLGKKEKKLGIRASSTCEVILDKVELSEAQVLGKIGEGYKIAIETLNEGRIGIAAQMLGLAGGALQGAFAYAGERQQFGKTINSFQGVQFQLAELAAKLEAARLLVYNAARLKDSGHSFVKEAAIAKYLCSEIAEHVASKALEIYGGYGFIKEFPAEKFYRDVKIGKLYEGTSNLQLQTIFKFLQA